MNQRFFTKTLVHGNIYLQLWGSTPPLHHFPSLFLNDLLHTPFRFHLNKWGYIHRMCLVSNKFEKKLWNLSLYLGRKCKIFPVQAMNANEKVEVKYPRILNFRIRCRWASTTRRLFLFIYLCISLFMYLLIQHAVSIKQTNVHLSNDFLFVYFRFRTLNLKNISSGFYLRNVCF